MNTPLNPLQILKKFYEDRVKASPKITDIQVELGDDFVHRGILPKEDRALASLCYEWCTENEHTSIHQLVMMIETGGESTSVPLRSPLDVAMEKVFEPLLDEIIYSKVPGSFRLANPALGKDWHVFTFPHELSEGVVPFEPNHPINDFYPKLHRIFSGEVIFDGEPELPDVRGREIVGEVSDLTVQQIYTLGTKCRALQEKLVVDRNEVERMYVWEYMLHLRKMERIISQVDLTTKLVGYHLPLAMKKRECGHPVSAGAIVCKNWQLVGV